MAAQDTICRRFLEVCNRDADRESGRPAIIFPRKGKWIEQTWSNYKSVVEEVCLGLRSLGIEPKDRVAILSNTRPEWAYCDMAILCLGAITVPIYHSNTTEDIAHILINSESKVLICENLALLKKFNEIASQTKVTKVVCIDFDSDKMSDKSNTQVLSFEKLQELGTKLIKATPNAFQESAKKVNLEDVATIVYTSGTTGVPKGVVLTHTQIMSEVVDTFPLLGISAKDRTLTFLPFTHVMGRIELWGHTIIGYTMCYAEGIDRIRDNFSKTKPTVMIAVPRVFEKIYSAIQLQAETSKLEKKIFDWAVSIGRQVSQCKLERRALPIQVALQYQLAKKLVFDKINAGLGGHLRFVFSGGAPINQNLAEFFHAVGLTLLEGYGLTETTAAITVNTPFDYKFGTVGKPIGDVKLKLAEDGEILVQSKKVMKEYYLDPEATSQVMDGGWFKTGDIGEFTPDGFLKITDRKKDLIKSAGGKFIAPQKIEALLKQTDFISNVYVHGDQKKYVVALVTLDSAATKHFAETNDISYKDFASLVKNPKIKEHVHDIVSEANSHLASYETVKNFEIIDHEFSIESGELTPSLKVKRKFVDEKYKDLLEAMY